MKTAIPKTEEEIKQEAEFTPIRCADYRTKYDYWECDDCHVVFEAGDFVLLKRVGDRATLTCPLIKKKLISRIFFSRLITQEPCLNQLSGADKAWYEARYKISEYEPNA